MSIPSVDLSDFLSGDTGKKRDFVQKLGKAYEEIVFVARSILTTHPIQYSDITADEYLDERVG